MRKRQRHELEAALEGAAAETDWSDVSKIGVLLDFLADVETQLPTLGEQFEVYLDNRVAEEHELAEPNDVTVRDDVDDADEDSACRVCGRPCFVAASGVSHHASEETTDGIDYDLDADHVAVPENQE